MDPLVLRKRNKVYSRKFREKCLADPPRRLRLLAYQCMNRSPTSDRDALYALADTAPIRCSCCGKELQYSTAAPKNDRPSIDRVDNAKPYIKGNIAIICGQCNVQKRDNTLQTLQMITAYILRYYDGSTL